MYGPPYLVSNNCRHALLENYSFVCNRTGLLSTPPRWLIPETVPPKVAERSMLHATVLLHISLAFVIQLAGIGSAVVSFLIALGVGVGVAAGIISDFMSGNLGEGNRVPPIVSAQYLLSMSCSVTNIPKSRLTSSALYCHLRMGFNWPQEHWTSSFLSYVVLGILPRKC
jgi:hypothetical protein